MIHFTSKDAMDIRGFGDANIKKFFDLKFLHDIPGIYTLPFEKISKLEGFGEKSINNLKTAIENSKTQPIHRLIFALGIRFVGETTAKTLAQTVKHILDFEKCSAEELQSLEDIGPKVANSIYQFFHNDDNILMLQKLESLGVQLANKKRASLSDSILDGQTFLFTGSLPTLKRTDAEEMVEQNGGKLLGNVSSKLNFLVVGEDAGSKLEKAKKISSIKIISEADFLNLIRK
jgi:DNA ligase (NAD+)